MVAVGAAVARTVAAAGPAVARQTAADAELPCLHSYENPSPFLAGGDTHYHDLCATA